MTGVAASSGQKASRRQVVGLAALGFLAAAGAGWGIGSLSASGSHVASPSSAAAPVLSTDSERSSGTWSDLPVAVPVLSAAEDRIVVEPAVVDPTETLPADTVTELLPGGGDRPPTTRVVPPSELEPMPLGTVPAVDVDDDAAAANVRMPVPAPVDTDSPEDPERVRVTPDPPIPGGPGPGAGVGSGTAPTPDGPEPAPVREGTTGDDVDGGEDDGEASTEPAGVDEEGRLLDGIGDPILGEPPTRPVLIDLCTTEDPDELCGLGVGAIVAFGMGGGDDSGGFPGIGTPIGIDDVPRPGRPEVRLIELAERSYRLVVPRQENERSELWVIPREPDQETTACDRAVDLASAGHPGMLAPSGRAVVRVVVGGDGPDAQGGYTMSDFYEFDLPTSGVYDVCLTWYQDLAPARSVVERESWTLIPEGRKRVKIHYGRVDLEPPRDRVLTQPQSLREIVVTFTDSTGRELCYSGILGLGPENTVLCEFDVSDTRELVSASIVPRLDAASGLRTDPPSLHALPIGTGGNPCFDGSESQCKHFSLRIAGALDGDGPWTIGTAQLMVTYEEPDARAAVSERQWMRTGSFEGEAEDPSIDPDAPRLDLTATRIAYYPTADPFRAWVHWKADRPVAGALVQARVRGTQCNQGAPPPEGVLRSGFTNTDQGVAIVAVCPGSDHAVSITFEADDGQRIVFSPEAPTTGDARHHYWWGGSHRTPAIDLPLQVAMSVDWRVGSSYWSHVRWYASLNDQTVFTENRHTDFFGTRPSCGKLEEFDISADRATPTPVTRRVGATVYARLDVFVDLGQSRNLVGQCMSPPTHHGSEVIIASLPIETLVRTGRMVTSREFEVTTPSGDHHIYEATYRVSTPYEYEPPSREPGT